MAMLVAVAGLMHAPSPLFGWQCAWSLLAIAALVSGSSALNMYLERTQDQKMARTMDRPLPSGRLSAWWGIAVGLCCSLTAIILLYEFTNILTLFLGLLAFVMYVFCYTPLKRITWFALIVGSIPGAMPVVLGYISSSNAIDVKAISLFSWAFLWQVPHFLAISLFREQEYTDAGFPVFSARFGMDAAKLMLLATSWLLALSTLGLYFSGILGITGLVIGLALGGVFLTTCHRGAFSMPTDRWAKRAFKASIFYQGALFVLLILGAVM